MEDAKKERFDAKPVEVAEAGVLGAGVMGGGIAYVVADKTNANVRMRDINWNAIAGGYKAASKIWKFWKSAISRLRPDDRSHRGRG